MTNIIRPKLQSQFGLAGPVTGERRKAADPGTRRNTQRRSRAGAYPTFGDDTEAQSHEERISKMIGGDAQ